MKYFIQTFGCAQNTADSQRIASYLEEKGMKKAQKIEEADYVVINTCMVREMAENRVYGLINNLQKTKDQRPATKIVVTGCMIGMAVRDKTGKFLKTLKKKMPQVDEFLAIDEIGFSYLPLRDTKDLALVPISVGCNNFCSYCVVPYCRGREVSRPYEEILAECKNLAKEGYKKIMLLGMNVNSYGSDIILNPKSEIRNPKQSQNQKNINSKYSDLENSDLFRASNFDIRISKYKPVYVKHLGRLRIPTLFPHLLSDVCKIEGIEYVDFMSSNPWDFSDELIEVIAANPKITRNIHLPVQSGSDSVLKRMNRWYSRNEYIKLIDNLKLKIDNLQISTDIIVGFCGETQEEFEETVKLAKEVKFSKAYVAMYSDRPMTAAHKTMKDDIPPTVKKKRWKILEDMINKPNWKKKI